VISIEQSIAAAFQLKTYQNVIVSKVDKKVDWAFDKCYSNCFMSS